MGVVGTTGVDVNEGRASRCRLLCHSSMASDKRAVSSSMLMLKRLTTERTSSQYKSSSGSSNLSAKRWEHAKRLLAKAVCNVESNEFSESGFRIPCNVVNLEAAVGEGRNEVAERGDANVNRFGVAFCRCKSRASAPNDCIESSMDPSGDGSRGTGGTGDRGRGESEWTSADRRASCFAVAPLHVVRLSNLELDADLRSSVVDTKDRWLFVGDGGAYISVICASSVGLVRGENNCLTRSACVVIAWRLDWRATRSGVCH